MFDTVAHDEPIAQIAAGIEALAAEDRSGWLGPALSERLSEAISLRERLDAEIVRLTGEWDRSRAWEADGALSAASWLAHRLPMSRSRARHEVRTARLVDRNERTAKALAAGDISSEHAHRLSRVVADHRTKLFADHQDALLDAAMSLDVDDFTKVVRRWSRLADDELASTDFMRQHEHRRLSVSTTFEGAVAVDGMLDSDGGADFLAAIDKLSQPDPIDGPDQPRTAAQRRADAVVQMARIVLHGDGQTGLSPRTLNVVADGDTLAGSKRPVPMADRRSDLEWVGSIGRDTLLRLGCDSFVCRVVMKGRSEVLDMGRKTRLVTTVQRRALTIRDDGCVFPGCDRPDSWCDAHHLDHWVHGGPTDLDNLALLCRRHHVLCHEGGWQLEPVQGGGFRARAPDR